jgi:hypothetical protein
LLKALSLELVTPDQFTELTVDRKDARYLVSSTPRRKFTTGLHKIMSSSSSASTASLVDYIIQNDFSNTDFSDFSDIQESLGNTLIIREEEGCTALYLMACYAPYALTSLITYLAQHASMKINYIKQCIADALIMKNDDGWTPLHVMAVNELDLESDEASALTSLMSYLTTQNNDQSGTTQNNDQSGMKTYTISKLVSALVEKTNKGVTALQMILECAPSAFIQLLELIENCTSTCEDIKIDYEKELMESIKINFEKALMEIFQKGEAELNTLLKKAFIDEDKRVNIKNRLMKFINNFEKRNKFQKKRCFKEEDSEGNYSKKMRLFAPNDDKKQIEERNLDINSTFSMNHNNEW